MYTIYTYLWLIWVGYITYLTMYLLFFGLPYFFHCLLVFCWSTCMVLSWLFFKWYHICRKYWSEFLEMLWALEKYNWLPSALLFKEKKKCFFGSCKRCVDACKQASLWLLARNLMEHYYIVGISMPRLLYLHMNVKQRHVHM